MSEKVEESCEIGSREYYEKALNKNVEYYVKAFKRLDETGKNTWNWAAFLCGPLWMFYRKMYLYSMMFIFIVGYIVSLVVGSVIGFISVLVDIITSPSIEFIDTSISPCTEFLAKLIAILVVRILCGYFGNAMYYSLIKVKTRKGYHLLSKYSPTSFISALLWPFAPFVCLADWISRKRQLKTDIESEVNEETIRAYLNSYKKNS